MQAAAIIDAATRKGLLVGRDARPVTPFLFIGIPTVEIVSSGTLFRFPGIEVVFFYDDSNIITHVGARQTKGTDLHPHIGISTEAKFCFGDNVSTINWMISQDDGFADVLLNFVIDRVKLYTRGAYATVGAANWINNYCHCLGGDRVCTNCEITCAVTGITAHANQFAEFDGEYVLSSIAHHVARCKRCNRLYVKTEEHEFCNGCNETPCSCTRRLSQCRRQPCLLMQQPRQ